MKRILLTSAGFESPGVMHCFLQLLGKPAAAAKALFIPTAAIDQDARAVLPKCWDDLIRAGFPAENITTFDLDRPMGRDELAGFDVVYFCGGSTEYLLGQVKAQGFDRALAGALPQGLVYVGVSAGSIIAAGNLPDSLGYLPQALEVHCEKGSPLGPLPQGTVYLTNAQAVEITDAGAVVVGP